MFEFVTGSWLLATTIVFCSNDVSGEHKQKNQERMLELICAALSIVPPVDILVLYSAARTSTVRKKEGACRPPQRLSLCVCVGDGCTVATTLYVYEGRVL